ncbi:MAG: hypothetical protein QHJ73_18070, partial [Armatimonadota bacterium]|nr:hypothetical protein [Armatimonadota bacterium]
MAEALSKETGGLDVLEIAGKRYTKLHKNLWRCAWGEHFDLDLDLPIPDKVDEEVILEHVRRHGFRGGEMGSCLRYCLPSKRRYFDLAYTNAPRRRRDVPTPAYWNRGFEEQVLSLALGQGADFVVVTPNAALDAMGAETHTYLPDGVCAVSVGVCFRQPEGADTTAPARAYLLETAAYDVARALERAGYSAVCDTAFPEKLLHGSLAGIPQGWRVQTATLFTSAPLTPTGHTLSFVPHPSPSPEQSAARLKQLLSEWGADLVGIAPAETLAALKPHLEPLFAGQVRLHARDRSMRFREYDPEVREEPASILTPEEHLRGARSVIVLGLRLPRATVERVALPPAEAVGPYAFAQYQAANQLRWMAYRAIRWLEDRGYRGALTFDLCGTGSFVGNPRGEQPDAFCNRFAAVAAGLARLGRAGFPLTPDLGPNVRFAAIVTDAEVAPDTGVHPAVREVRSACEGCTRCLEACPTAAIGPEVSVPVRGLPERFHVVDRTRCDWAKRYSLIGEEGVN